MWTDLHCTDRSAAQIGMQLMVEHKASQAVEEVSMTTRATMRVMTRRLFALMTTTSMLTMMIIEGTVRVGQKGFILAVIVILID